MRGSVRQLYEPRSVPWSQVHSWTCNGCGECCKWFTIPISTYEYAKIGQVVGFRMFEFREGGVWLKKRPDSRCVFAFCRGNLWLCGLQNSKPYPCRMWPFKISNQPLYGRRDWARYEGSSWTGYVYVDSRCPGIVYGRPSLTYTTKVVEEFVHMAIGGRRHQYYSTSREALSQTWNRIQLVDTGNSRSGLFRHQGMI